jgi:hypothetical protein
MTEAGGRVRRPGIHQSWPFRRSGIEASRNGVAAFLLSRKESPKKVFVDWCKWVGFAFPGFAVPQFISIQHEKLMPDTCPGRPAARNLSCSGRLAPFPEMRMIHRGLAEGVDPSRWRDATALVHLHPGPGQRFHPWQPAWSARELARR